MDSATRGTITNDTIWEDRSGDEIWSNGGQITKFGDQFYWIGYETAPGTYPDDWRVTLYRSTNLADWEFLGNVIEPEGEFAQFDWAGRPTLLHSQEIDRYVVVFEAVSEDWPRHKIGYAVAREVDGAYSLANCAYPEPDQSAGDQSVFTDGGDAYLVTVLDGELGVEREFNQRLGIYRLTGDRLGVDEKVFDGFDRRETERGLEAPHVFRRDGTYYLFGSGLAWWQSTPTKYSTAASLDGPWTDLKRVQNCLSHGGPPIPRRLNSCNSQHDFVLPVRGTETTTYLYGGDRYTQYHGYGVGRNVFLPVVWDDETPQLHWQPEWHIDTETGQWEPGS